MRGMYMADWMANAICGADMEEDAGIKELQDYIFSFAKEMGYEDFVEYDTESGKYYATDNMDDELVTQALITRYDERTTWDELAEWLGERNFFMKYSHEEIEKMTQEERFIKHMECQISWEREFEKYDVQRLSIDKTIT